VQGGGMGIVQGKIEKELIFLGIIWKIRYHFEIRFNFEIGVNFEI
jgi:hypothetical protein